MTITSRPSIRSIAAATALGVALATGTIGAGIANAQPVFESNIDFSKEGSITIHKRDLAPDQEWVEPTGNENLNAPGTALAGAGFTLYPITNADLTTNAGFKAAAELTPDTAEIGAAVRSGTSDANGVIEFTALRVGAYLLRETTSPTGYSPAADSIVFIPMTNPDDLPEWNYDVHVYPKNTKNEVVKEVEDAGANVGDNVTYTITSDIPRVVERANETTVISKYEVYDDLDETRLLSPAVTVALSNGTAFVNGTDYDLTIDPDTLEVKVVFTPTGLGKLTTAVKANPATKVVTTLTSEIKAIGDGNWEIANDSFTITNNGGGGGHTTTESNEVKSYHGILEVFKFEQDGTNRTALKDATFQLYVCEDQDNLIGDPLTVGGRSEWTTDDDGIITINALQVTDFRNDEEIAKDDQDQYCLVETEAPEGYELLPTPIAIEFTRMAVENTNDGTNAVTLRADVENVKSVAPQLPLTGGAGIGLLAALGGLVVAAGAWVARRMNRA